MRRAHALIIVVAVFGAQLAFAAEPAVKTDPAAGRRAFEEAKCSGCHDKLMGGDGNRIFTRPDRKLTSAPALGKMVRFCIDRTGANVFPEDAEHIIAYLNQQFYKFK